MKHKNKRKEHILNQQASSYEYPVKGLTQAEVESRYHQGLRNQIPDSKSKSNWDIIRDNVFTLFNLLNIIIGIALALVGAWANLTFLAVIFLNSTIGVFQQWYAKWLVEKLSLLSQSMTKVLRDNQVCQITVDELVLDDVCILEMGGQICADSQVLSGEIEVNESLLTGEADPIIKKQGDKLLSGSFVVSGRCFAKVEHVGMDNFVYQLSHGAKKHRKMKSQLVDAMGRVTKLTGYFILPVGLLLFIQAFLFRGDTLFLSVVSTAAALLGMLPKGLVLLISISLATGVIALSKKRVLVQDLYCIEALSHVDMLCLDKTGTITQGEMQVLEALWLEQPAVFSGQEALESYLAVCEDNNATILALKNHFSPHCNWQVVSKKAFSSQRKWGSVTFDSLGTYVLGAPEMLLGASTTLPEFIETGIRIGMEAGDRVLCFGYSQNIPDTDAPLEVLPLAFIRINDPVRPEARETLSFFRQEGVTIKVISGDNPQTVSAVARKAGLEGYDRCIDLSLLQTEEEIRDAAIEYTVFGRVSPTQKCTLVKALQEKGHTVAMTGDGVNDVLALRQADCSIAIGSGSDAARQVSQLVLLDGNFDALPHILYEGRRVVNNITRVAGLFFIKTLYSAFLSMLSLLMLLPFPFIPIQITLMDCMLEGFPSLFLSFEPDHKKIKGSFLPTVILQAMPYALLIFINHIILTWGLPLIGITEFGDGTVLYYISGFAYLLALLRSCKPLNVLRIILCILSAVGFYLCAGLFAPILYLESVSFINVGLFAALAILSIPVTLFFTYCSENFFSYFRKSTK